MLRQLGYTVHPFASIAEYRETSRDVVPAVSVVDMRLDGAVGARRANPVARRVLRDAGDLHQWREQHAGNRARHEGGCAMKFLR
jgi:hypothetical protein